MTTFVSGTRLAAAGVPYGPQSEPLTISLFKTADFVDMPQNNPKFRRNKFSHVRCLCKNPNSYPLEEVFATLNQNKTFCQECGYNSDIMMLYFMQVYLRDYIKKKVYASGKGLAINICSIMNSFSTPKTQSDVSENILPTSIISLMMLLRIQPLSVTLNLYDFEPDTLRSFKLVFIKLDPTLHPDILAIIDDKIDLIELLEYSTKEFHACICGQEPANQLDLAMIYRINDSFMNRFTIGELITLLEKILSDKCKCKHILLSTVLFYLNNIPGELSPEDQYRLIHMLIGTRHFSHLIYFFPRLQFTFKEDEKIDLIILFYQSYDRNSDRYTQFVQMLDLWAYLMRNDSLDYDTVRAMNVHVDIGLAKFSSEHKIESSALSDNMCYPAFNHDIDEKRARASAFFHDGLMNEISQNRRQVHLKGLFNTTKDEVYFGHEILLRLLTRNSLSSTRAARTITIEDFDLLTGHNDQKVLTYFYISKRECLTHSNLHQYLELLKTALLEERSTLVKYALINIIHLPYLGTYELETLTLYLAGKNNTHYALSFLFSNMRTGICIEFLPRQLENIFTIINRHELLWMLPFFNGYADESFLKDILKIDYSAKSIVTSLFNTVPIDEIRKMALENHNIDFYFKEFRAFLSGLVAKYPKFVRQFLSIMLIDARFYTAVDEDTFNDILEMNEVISDCLYFHNLFHDAFEQVLELIREPESTIYLQRSWPLGDGSPESNAVIKSKIDLFKGMLMAIPD